MPKTTRPLTTKQEHWRRQLEACRRSGTSMADYARRHDLSRAQLYSWRRRLKQLGVVAGASTAPARARAQTPPSRASFSAVRLIDSSFPSGGELRIRLANGVTVEIADPSAWLPDANLLALLAALR